MYQQLWGYKVEEKLYLGVREQKRLNTTVQEYLKVPSNFLASFVELQLSVDCTVLQSLYFIAAVRNIRTAQ
jgi:hypothetical protein